MSDPVVRIFGIRHHGPGSARSLLRALHALNPDCVLIEGPPDADGIIADCIKESMTPPVALLVYDEKTPSRAVYYPLAEFSPEWQAMRWAQNANVPVRFMDLPQWHRVAMEAAREQSEQSPADPAAAPPPPSESIDRPPPADPLGELARAAGFDDGERWWEHVVEHRTDDSAGLFDAIRDAMAELRQAQTHPRDADEPAREAWMRRTIRKAHSEGFSRIAVVCGAWHAPALDVEAVKKKDDEALLKGLPKVTTAATWVPWTYDRLTYFSGYGAGVASPGWYDHLWRHGQGVVEIWMTRVARLLREKDIDCSSAHIIEATRLSQTLATLRGRPLADLSDIADATRSVFCFDSDLPMRLIARELLVGLRIGEVPPDTPAVPLLADLRQLQKRLRLPPDSQDKELDLDLRNDTDRQRSFLLHRLRLLGVDWGVPTKGSRGKGTFHELWRIRWDPVYAIRLIEAGALGNTVVEAAAKKLGRLAADSADLAQLTSYLHDAMLADLGDAITPLVQQIENVSAVLSDVTLLMQALPQLATVSRYGNVRQTEQTMVHHIIGGIVPRIVAALPGAVSSLNDDAAALMEPLIRSTHAAIELLENPEMKSGWLDCLLRIIDSDSVHGLVRGRCARILLDARHLSAEDIAARLGLVLSRGTDPAQSARWIEGFLSGSGLLLIHDAKLLAILDRWVSEIQLDLFEQLVPLLRRTFSTFPRPERRQIGQMLTAGASPDRTGAGSSADLHHDRAAAALPLLLKILGGKS